MADRVLIITYLFPPSGGVGVPRFVSYSRYLPKHDCQAFVLTVRNPATPTYDPDLARQVPPETRVYRAFNPEIPYDLRDRIWKRVLSGQAAVSGEAAKAGSGSSWKSLVKGAVQRVFSPDVQVVWVPFAIRQMRQIIARHKITAVIQNLPPYSCLKIAVAVKKHFPHVKLILDFRDEWIDNYFAQYDTAASDSKLLMARKLERNAVEGADFVTMVTRAQLAQIRRRYPEQPDSKFLYAPNGFEPDVYRNFRPRPAPDGKIVITHFGTIYDNPACRPFVNYLDAVDALPEEMRSRIETRMIGRVAREAAWYFENRKHTIRHYGFMSKEAAVPLLEESSYNLIVSANATTHGGKLFDYLAMGQPVLVLAPLAGEMVQVVRETRIGWCVEPDDRAGIREMLVRACERVNRGETSWEPDLEAIRRYQWPNLVARLAQLTGLGDAAGTGQPSW